MVVHTCCKSLFQMFHYFFRYMLQVCLLGCCICFIHMLPLFYLNVAHVLQWLFQVFSCVFCKCFQRMHVSSVSSVFRRMSQMFHLNVSKVDRVLYLPPRFLLPHLDISSQRRLGNHYPLSLFSRCW
jgi:hypothetical protein